MTSKTVDDPPNQEELIKVLVPKFATQWLTIGLRLGLSPQQLEEVRGNNRPDDTNG